MDAATNGGLRCFAPVTGIFLGAALAWILSLAVAPKDDVALELAVRFAVLTFSLLGWSVGVMLGQGRAIHCGASQELKDKGRAAALVVAGFFLIVVETLTLTKGWTFWYWFVLLLFFATFIGEVGWGRPFYVMEKIWAA